MVDSVEAEVSCPFWEFDDVSRCARLSIFELKVPLVVLSVSVLTIVIKTIINYLNYRKKLNIEYEPLLTDETAVDSYSDERHAFFTESIKKSHLDLSSLPPVKLNGQSLGFDKVIPRSLSEKLRVVLEETFIVIEILLNAYKLKQPEEFSTLSTSVNVALWTWLLTLTTFRVINLNEQNKLSFIPNLWRNNFIVYLVLLFSKILILRSALIGHTQAEATYVSEFLVLAILFVNLLTSTVGFTAPKIFITDENIKPASEPTSSFFDLMTFSWINSFLSKAYQNAIEYADVWDLRKDDYSYYVIKDFKKFSEAYPNWSFQNRLIWFFRYFLLTQAAWCLTESIILFIPTMILRQVLEFVEHRESGSLSLAWFYVFAMFFFKFISVIASGQALFTGRRVCIRLKSLVISEIYGKALRRRVSQQDKKDTDTDEEEETEDSKKDEAEADGEDEKSSANLGAIINLMAVDSYKVSEICAYAHTFLGAIIMIFIAITLLYNLLGWSAIIGAVAIISVSPVNFKLANKLGEFQKLILGVTDKRIQKLNETLQSIRIVKFFAWENKFIDEILEIRKLELYYLKMRSVVWAASAFLWFITPTIVTFFSFGAYIFISKKTLTTPIAFTSLSLFNLLRTPLDQLNEMLSFAIQSKVSMDRIQEFLSEEESSKYEQLTEVPNTGKVGFKNASFSWNLNSETDFKLRDLNVEFKKGKLNVIIGATGSGKTSMLMALLGEMTKTSGEIYLSGYKSYEELLIGEDGYTDSVAYCSQSAWLLNDTIKNNILFAAPFNKKRYNDVVSACGLARDFEILKAGDQTEIGEKGIALSGGQKQRVSLARALYSNSRTILLDDCLSAVDSHTALHIYENCISGPLMTNRTVLLVSHNVALTVRSAEFVVSMENGRIVNQGTPEKLLQAGAFGDDEMIKSSVQSRSNSHVNLKKVIDDSSSKDELLAKLDIQKTIKNDFINDEEEEELENLKMGKLIEDEAKSEGNVSKDVYIWFYKLFGGTPIFMVVALTFILSQSLNISQSWWVRKWAHDLNDSAAVLALPAKSTLSYAISFYQARQGEMQALKERDPAIYYIVVYALLGLSYSTISCLRIIFVYFQGIKASSRIFKIALNKVMRAKLRFFDSTPIGRIMNRFSKDVEAIDQDLTPVANGAVACLSTVIFTLILITYITPGFLFFGVIITSLYYFIGTFYLSTSRELKRFDSITKSPIHQHFSETLVGVSTIRAYGIERRFLLENVNKIDNNNRPFFYMWVANRWLSTRNDLVGALVVLFSGIFVLLKIDSLDAGMAGISLSYAISFNEAALWVVRLYAEVEMAMNSVERLKEYLDIEEEPAEFVPDNEPPANWPHEGRLEISDLSLRYAAHLPKVIKNVSFDVDPNNKIGIVGRTGAGKSTIITALFRFLDPETGYIKIDGIDVTSIGLKNLRQAITIIPQDPTLFTGTIKSNLDPFDSCTDDQIFEALRRVNLVTVEELEAKKANPNPLINSAASTEEDENVNKFLNLANEISEGGGNLSQGQRQLMCLARSLLKSPKIMLLDEATASIDYESDAKIQQTIRQEFSDSTILTIAHRLRSIIDYDKILVMDSGEVVEFDHPFTLLSNEDSIFYSMCKDSGELDVLIQLAKDSFNFRNN
ncbi:hypothetical protein WICPIJ_005848 [Wickerhamomyces pijperi]|uniref:ATP-dependent bile acid permease n=1 Tax=Wickerhamomyces pijperi TaxID=599730 RepID=A0A9P8TLJ1_WICPI|nr:hypothetical protein WICPIJ_005848 [Wickerhamomyces pijperi]